MFSKTFRDRIDTCNHHEELTKEAKSIISALYFSANPEEEVCDVLELCNKLQYILKRINDLKPN